MKSSMKIAVVSAVLAVGAAVPAMAQFDTVVEFTTSVPFYAGKVQMPPGSYEIKQPDMSVDQLLIQSVDRTHSAFVYVTPTYSVEPQQKTDVTLRAFGSVEYLDRISIEGATHGMLVTPTKAEQAAESAAGL
jgi:hypothetical protein